MNVTTVPVTTVDVPTSATSLALLVLRLVTSLSMGRNNPNGPAVNFTALVQLIPPLHIALLTPATTTLPLTCATPSASLEGPRALGGS